MIKEITYKNTLIKASNGCEGIKCNISGKWLKYNPLNLGECNDGRKFTHINQAVNQAKQFIDSFIK